MIILLTTSNIGSHWRSADVSSLRPFYLRAVKSTAYPPIGSDVYPEAACCSAQYLHEAGYIHQSDWSHIFGLPLKWPHLAMAAPDLLETIFFSPVNRHRLTSRRVMIAFSKRTLFLIIKGYKTFKRALITRYWWRSRCFTADVYCIKTARSCVLRS